NDSHEHELKRQLRRPHRRVLLLVVEDRLDLVLAEPRVGVVRRALGRRLCSGGRRPPPRGVPPPSRLGPEPPLLLCPPLPPPPRPTGAAPRSCSRSSWRPARASSRRALATAPARAARARTYDSAPVRGCASCHASQTLRCRYVYETNEMRTRAPPDRHCRPSAS